MEGSRAQQWLVRKFGLLMRRDCHCSCAGDGRVEEGWEGRDDVKYVVGR